jgi:hypothetical protein
MEKRTEEGKLRHDLGKKIYYEKKQAEKIQHEKENAINLGIYVAGARVSDYLLEKIKSGKTQILVNDDGSIIPFRKKVDGPGYWFNTSYIKGKILYLHREKLKRHLGLSDEAMNNYEVHHIDQNVDNNDIENLQLVTREMHHKIHGELLTEEQREKRRENMNRNARPAAIKWHQSEEGREWHKKQYKISLGSADRKKIKKICDCCGREYEVYDNGTSRFCSNNCKSKWRRDSGIDNVEKTCVGCGKTFITNKYSKAIYCSNICSSKARWK